MGSNKFDSIAFEMTRILKNQSIITKDEEIYQYGIKELIWNFLHVMTVITIGFLLKRPWALVSLMLYYCPVRVYAGGYHANTRRGCYVGTIFLSILLLGMYEILSKLSISLNVVLITICILVIYALSPDEAINNPLESYEKLRYRKNSLKIMNIQALITSVLYLLGFKQYVNLFSSALIVVILMILLHKVKKYFRKQRII